MSHCLSSRSATILSTAFVCALLYLSLAPGYLIQLSLAGHWTSLIPTYTVKPFLFGLIAFLAILSLKTPFRTYLPNSSLVGLWGLSLIGFVAIDAVHYLPERPFDDWIKYLFYDKAFSSFLVMSLCFLLTQAVLTALGHDRTMCFFSYVIITTAVLTLALFFATHAGIFQTAKAFGIDYSFLQIFLTNNNKQAMEGLSLLALVILFGFCRENPIKRAGLIFLCTFIPFLMTSRSAMGAAAILCLADLISLSLKHHHDRKTLLKLAAPSFLALALLVTGMKVDFSPWLSWGYYSGKGFIVDEAGQNKPIGRKVIEVETAKAADQEGVWDLLEELWTEFEKDPSRRVFEYEANTTLQASDSTVSSFSRIGTTLVAMKTFLEHPLTGIGIWDVFEIKVAAFGVHGLLPLLLAGCGIVGLLFFATPLTILAAHANKRNWIQPTTLIALAIVTSFFVNIFHWWFGFLIAVYLHENKEQINKKA